MKFTTELEYSWAYGDKLFVLNTGEWRYQRPVHKTRKCCKCGMCYLFCPCGCVTGSGTCVNVNLQYCKGCGICAQLCPRSAIQMVREF